MSRRRKNRQQAQQPALSPAQAPAEASTPALPLDELTALRDRLAALEHAQKALKDVWWPHDRLRLERDQWIKARTRTDHEDPCAACGRSGGDQHRVEDATVLGRSVWACPACTQAVMPGWGTQVTKILPERQGLDRLAALAAGMTEPTPSFLTLAARYGLEFKLYRDVRRGDGTPWSHLDDPKMWREVGAKAVRRHAAGVGVFPTVDVAELLKPREQVLTRVPDWEDARGYRMDYVPVEPEQPTQDELRAQLEAEEKAIEAALKEQKREQARAEKERVAREEAQRREEEIRAHYAEHRARLDRQYELAKADLRAQLDSVLRAERGGL